MATLSPDIDYADRGSGPALLFVPGSFGTGAGWRAVIDNIGEGYRIVSTSLLGYGATAERRPSHNPPMAEQVEVLDEIFDRIDAPAHVVGHSYGGLATVAHAILGRRKPASLVLVEANPLDILRAAGDQAHYDMFGAMTKVYFAVRSRQAGRGAPCHRLLRGERRVRCIAPEGSGLRRRDDREQHSRLGFRHGFSSFARRLQRNRCAYARGPRWRRASGHA